jgi:hypothetical protein
MNPMAFTLAYNKDGANGYQRAPNETGNKIEDLATSLQTKAETKKTGHFPHKCPRSLR